MSKQEMITTSFQVICYFILFTELTGLIRFESVLHALYQNPINGKILDYVVRF